MAILAECPVCHKKQSLRNRICACGEDIVRAKRSQKVRYWINYRFNGGKQRREAVGYSLEEARDAEGKRRGQKRENRIFEILPESKITFSQLSAWYLELESIKKLSIYDRVQCVLKNFCSVFGQHLVNTIKPIELEEYQNKREKDGLAPATIDMEISIAKTMVNKAFDNDMIQGHVVRAFRKVKRKLKKGSNARKRILTFEEYSSLIHFASPHLREIIIVDFNTGMRSGELRMLKWDYIDTKHMFIRLPETVTKEGKPKNIPINHHVLKVFQSIPNNHEFIFTFRGKPIRERGGLKRSFKTACRKAGIPCGRAEENGITFHDIRRTVKTNMLNAGIDKAHRDMILGHSLKGMDAHYLAPSEEDLTKAMDRYTQWIDKNLSKTSLSVDLISASVDLNVDQARILHFPK
ncbi:MAG: tyrosine-type recombinase/integrase [bacterium]